MRYPTIPYPGGKGRLARTIVSLFPKAGNLFIDVFAGHGNVFWCAAETLNYTQWQINDISTAPMFEAIRAIGSDIEIPERSKDEYYRQWELAKVGDQRALILEPYLCFGGGNYGRSGPGGKKSAAAPGYTKTIRRCNQILLRTDAKITALDYLKVGLENLTEHDSVYLDPPYKEADVRSYKPGQLNHIEMVEMMKRTRAKWVLSEFYDPLYVNAFGEPCYRKDVQLNAVNFAKNLAKGKDRRIECIWKNF